MKTVEILRAGTLVVSAFALLAGCSARIAVQISGSLEQPVARFGNDPVRPETVCVDAIAVQELVHTRMAPVWSARASGDRCRRLAQITYGQVPKGFEAAVEAASLREGVRYYVSATGRTGGPLSRVPWMGGDEYIFENGAWHPVRSHQAVP